MELSNKKKKKKKEKKKSYLCVYLRCRAPAWPALSTSLICGPGVLTCRASRSHDTSTARSYPDSETVRQRMGKYKNDQKSGMPLTGHQNVHLPPFSPTFCWLPEILY